MSLLHHLAEHGRDISGRILARSPSDGTLRAPFNGADAILPRRDADFRHGRHALVARPRRRQRHHVYSPRHVS